MTRRCDHRPTGYVTNQPDIATRGLDQERPHASIHTCTREACLDASIRWVAASTNETAIYVPFGGGR